MTDYNISNMPKLSLILLLVFVQFIASGQEKQLTYKQVFEHEGPSLFQDIPGFAGWFDDNNYLESRKEENGTKIYKIDVIRGKEKLYLNYSYINKNLPDGFSLENNVAKTHNLLHYILSKNNDLYYYNVISKSFRQLTFDEWEEKNPTFSPDANKIAFTRNNDLYCVNLETGKETRLTNDGSDVIYNGYASWVYYEEILGRSSRYKAFWWSPDASMIAFLRFDDSPVPVFPIYHTDGTHGSLETMHYPKAGDPNPLVTLAVYKLENDKTTWIETNDSADRYIAWPSWTPDSKELVYQYMNRDQDEITLYASDPETGDIRQLYSEKQSSWVEFFEDLYFFKDGSGFIVRSDKSGWRNLYYYSMDGKLKKELTNFNWRVTGIAGYSKKTKTLFFTGTGGTSTENHLFSLKLNRDGYKKITKSEGNHSVKLSPHGLHYYDSYSNINQPRKTGIFYFSGAQVRSVGNARSAEMDNYKLARTELFTIPTDDGYNLPAKWILPPSFDKDKKYPVILSIYGGPNAPSVSNSFPRSFGDHFLAQNGIIILAVDHRGTGHYGKKGTAMMHRKLGKWEMHDYIEAVKWLREKSFIDTARIAITGYSYGGYMTCLALTKGADYFKYGFAGGAVTDWHLYDNVYTERYMDTPEQNPEGYKNGSVLTWAHQLKGKLFMVHGAIDDNVHMQNAMQLIDRFQDLNKEFEMQIYPGQRHGIGGLKRNHYNREKIDFWFENLLGKEPDTSK